MTTPFMESPAIPYSIPKDKKEDSLVERAKQAQEARKKFIKESTIPAQDGFIDFSK